MGQDQKKKSECWEVRKLGKVAAEHNNATAADEDATERNNAAKLLGIKAVYVAIMRPAE